MDNKIELLKKMQESELLIIKGQHERALKRLRDQQSNELARIAKKHENAIHMTENRIVHLEQPATGQNTK